MKRFALLALASGLAIAAAAPANAVITISTSINGGAITQVANDGGTGSANYNTTTGGYFYNVSATGSPLLTMPQLLTQSVNIQNTGGSNGTIDIWITQSGLSTNFGGLASAFSSNTIAGATATLTSYYSASNYVPTTGSTGAQFLAANQQLQTATFTGLGTFAGTNTIAFTNPFSETVRYTLTFTGGNGSNFNGTANLTGAVPEPATWGMMIAGFGLLGGVMRRRKTSVAFA